MKTLIHNAQIVTAAGIHPGWVLTDGAIISATGDIGTALPTADISIDARGAYLLPGLIDTHVHFREPGLTHKGSIATESRAAAAGGIVEVFDMPNTIPATTTPALVAEKEALAQAAQCPVRYHALMGIVPGNSAEIDGYVTRAHTSSAGNATAALRLPVKLFLGTSTGAMAAPAGRELEDVFRRCADLDIPIMVHAEDNDFIAANTAAAIARYGSAEAVDIVKCHSEIRSEEACLRASARAVELAHRFGTALHLAHVSTAREVRELLTAGSTEGKLVTAETTPLYLDPVLADVAARSVRHKVNPAIKTPADAEALRQALVSGAIDTIGTDHAPHLLPEKEKPGLSAASGAPSVQFALPILASYLPLELIVSKFVAGPDTVFNLGANTDFTPGSRADMVLVEESEPYTITDADVLTPCGWTPFAGRTARHRVLRTWRGGNVIYNHDSDM